RAPQRFVLLADIGIAVLAGYGVAFGERVVAAANLPVIQNMSASEAALWATKIQNWSALGARQTGLVIALLAAAALELGTLPQPIGMVHPSPFFSQLRADG